MKKLYVLFLVLFLPALILSFGILSSGCQDSGATKGVINGMTWIKIDSNSKTQARYVTISVNGPSSATITSSASGVYNITGLPPGSYNVSADYTESPEYTASNLQTISAEVNDQPAAGFSEGYIFAGHFDVIAGGTTSVDFTLITNNN